MLKGVHAGNQVAWKSIANASKQKCLVQKYANAQDAKTMDFSQKRLLERLVKGIIGYVIINSI